MKTVMEIRQAGNMRHILTRKSISDINLLVHKNLNVCVCVCVHSKNFSLQMETRIVHVISLHLHTQ